MIVIILAGILSGVFTATESAAVAVAVAVAVVYSIILTFAIYRTMTRVMLVNCALGLNTPPVGTTQFVGCAIGGISVGEVMRTILPFYAALLATLLAVTYIPRVLDVAAEAAAGLGPSGAASRRASAGPRRFRIRGGS